MEENDRIPTYCQYCKGEINIGNETYVADEEGNCYHYYCYSVSHIHIDSDFVDEEDE